MSKRLFMSFSGGETSGRMVKWLKDHSIQDYDEVVCLFANTGEENEETLQFVKQCDEAFGLNVVWIETDIDPENRHVARFKVVDFDTASRNGEPFEKIIQAYGIPNPSWPHCTRELKTQPMTAYLRSIGWESGSYDVAIGIRSDEIDRVAPKATGKRFRYPFVTDVEVTKPMVNSWWRQQPFRLRLKGYQGNCKWCWKKTLRKHLTIMVENPEWFEFPERMERLYSHINPKADLPDRVFFRKNMSVKDLRAMALDTDFEKARDDAQVFASDSNLDIGSGCASSCEIDFSEVA